MKRIGKVFIQILFIVLSLFIVGCNEQPIEPTPEEKDVLKIEYDQLIYYSQVGKIKVSSIYEDDEIYIESLNIKVIKIDYEATDEYIAKAVGLGVAKIAIYSSYTEEETIIEITVEAKEGFAPPIESMELSIKEQGPYYVGTTYHLEYKIYPEIFNDKYRIIETEDYEVNQETGEIVFWHAGQVNVSIFAEKKAVRAYIVVDVEFDPNKEMYEVLFIGNSLTNVNDIPSIISKMIKADGVYFGYKQDTPGGTYLAQHRQKFDEYINNYRFTHVILQGQSYEAIDGYETFEQQIKYYDSKIKENGAQTILYQTWAYNRDVYKGVAKYEMTQKLADAYNKVANQIGAKVTKAGEAFKLFEQKIGLTPSLYQDMSHQNLYGAYLSACVHYSTLTGRRAVNNTYIMEGIDLDIIETIQKIADEISFGK